MDPREFTSESTPSFQLPGGPFKIVSTYYETNDERSDRVIDKIYENGKLVKEYSSAGLDEMAGARANRFIAQELESRYPDLLDKENLYMDNSLFYKMVPVNKLFTTVHEDVSRCITDIKRNEEFIKDHGFTDLLMKPSPINDYKTIKELVPERVFFKEDFKNWHSVRDEYSKLQKKYDSAKKTFDARDKPNIFNFFERRAYKQEERRVNVMADKLTSMENKINSMEKTINQKVERYNSDIEDLAKKINSARFDLAIDYDVLRELRPIDHKLGQISDKDQLISFTGNYKNTQTIMEQRKSIIKQAENIVLRESVRSPSIQLEGGPFTVRNSYLFDDHGREIDKNEIYENLKLVKTVEKPEMSEWGAYKETTEYVANRLINDYPEYLNREAYLGDEAITKEVYVADVLNSVRKNIAEFEKTEREIPKIDSNNLSLSGPVNPELTYLKNMEAKYSPLENQTNKLTFNGDINDIGNIQSQVSSIDAQIREFKVRDAKIQDYTPNHKLQGLPNQEYLKQAQNFKSNGAAINDEAIAKNMLSKGFSQESVARTISSHSPQYASVNSLRSAKDLVHKISKSPEMKHVLSKDLTR